MSATSDPTGPWRGAKLPLPRINPYMRMGVDRNGLYICSCNGNPDMHRGTNCYAIPKQDAIAATGPLLDRARSFDSLQFSAMPAMDLDPSKPADAPAILLANEFADGICSKLYLYQITWSGGLPTIFEARSVPLGKTYLTPNNSTPQMEAFQPAPGPKLRAGGGGRRIDSAFVRNGSVFGCNGAKRTVDSRPGILWYQIGIAGGDLVQEGLIDSPDRDFIFPSIAVDHSDNIGIGCTGTSQTEFPSLYIVGRAASDPPGTMRPPALAVQGATPYHYAGATSVNLSHYSTTCIDPSDPALIWTCQAYGNSAVDRQWCTAWTAFKIRSKSPGASGRPVKDHTAMAIATVSSPTTTVGRHTYCVYDYDGLRVRNVRVAATTTWDKPLTITSPGDCWPTMPTHDPGSDIPIIVDATNFPGWKTIAFCDGANKLGEITGGPTRFTARNLTAGYHVFTALATATGGEVRTTDPKLVVVRTPSARH